MTDSQSLTLWAAGVQFKPMRFDQLARHEHQNVLSASAKFVGPSGLPVKGPPGAPCRSARPGVGADFAQSSQAFMRT